MEIAHSKIYTQLNSSEWGRLNSTTDVKEETNTLVQMNLGLEQISNLIV